MKLDIKRKMTKKEQENFRWHCAFCGKVVPVDTRFILTLYLKGKKKPDARVVCEYWCPYDGTITRMEYKPESIKETERFIKEVNVYTDTKSNSVFKIK